MTLCVWGKNDRNYYSHFLKSKFLVSGSIRNNLYKKQKFKSNSRDIVFISQYRDNKKFLDNHIYYAKILLRKIQSIAKEITLICISMVVKIKILNLRKLVGLTKSY